MANDRPAAIPARRRALTAATIARHLVLSLAAIAVAGGLASCGGGSGSAQGPSGPVNTLQLTTSPALTRAFDPAVTDYAYVYKSGSPVNVNVAAPADTTVSIDGQPVHGSTFSSQVNLVPGQSFSFVVNKAGTSQTYYVRCLPVDFPAWTTERGGTPQADYYVFSPTQSTAGIPTGNYIIIADAYGVPMWWFKNTTLPVDTKLLPNGDIAWTSSPTGQEHKLDGSLVRSFTPTSPVGVSLDVHEIQLLPNGNYIYISDVDRPSIDLSSIGGLASETVLDTVIQEVTPAGALVWQWSSFDHTSLSEVDPIWRIQFVQALMPADPYHMNSVEPDGDGYIASIRHTNAIYRIDRATGNITWKLGGSQRAESLTFVGDPYGNFGGMHDARRLPDGTLSLHDNGSQRMRGPRAVRYRIDTAARTATLVEQVTDPEVPSSFCCGSATKLASGDWVMAWGGTGSITELTPSGSRAFRMLVAPPFFSYRAIPIAPGVLTRADLRKGMDAQYPR